MAALLSVYDGRETDVQDLKLIQKQLDLVETHYHWLQDKSLSEEAFEEVYQKCVTETENAFDGDVPPLDNEMIYASIRQLTLQNRVLLASNWMESNIPSLKEVTSMEAQSVINLKSRLVNMPAYLSATQQQQVMQVIEVCNKRLNELEVEGLIAQFEVMSEDNIRAFIASLISYIKTLIKEGLLDVSA